QGEDLLETVIGFASMSLPYLALPPLPTVDITVEGGLSSLYALVDLSPSFLLGFLVFLAIVRFLKLASSTEKAQVTTAAKEGERMRRVLKDMPILNDAYRPPWLWGRSGHLQTAAYGLLGHATLKRTADRRVVVKQPDGASLTFDVFEPLAKHPSGLDLTLCLTPGIANSSESNYIRTCVHYAQEAGYRCAVLNHLGAMVGVPLTSSRIFSYGGTSDLHSMVSYLATALPLTKFISIGFSMGANLTTKFLIEADEKLRSRIMFGLSVCQGYSATNSVHLYHDWENSRRAYNYVITENMKRLLRRNYDEAVAPHVESGLIDEQRLWSATSIVALDELYNRRVNGFDSLDNFYTWCSCLPMLDDLKVPMIFFNAQDDPIIPRTLWEPVKVLIYSIRVLPYSLCQELATRKEDVAFITTKHGGHLGFLEGSSIAPKSVTWIDRFIVEMCDSAVRVYGQK
ncbi:hypothetical protein PFISCL1PPCAC_19325, partial [Pristionchus fissidentatus]